MSSFAVGTIFTLLMVLQTHVAGRGVATPKLHHHMTKREIEYFFNVDDHDKVPEYHVTSPYQSNDAGDFVSYSLHPTREKRSTGQPMDHSFYKLDAFGSKLHLKLKKNEHLMAPGMKVSRENSDGTVTTHPAPQNTFYLGNVVSDPQSTVAVRNDRGLTGMVKTSRDTLFVHPLPEHLAKHVTSGDDATPHLVYRRSLREDDISYNKDVLKPESEDEEKSRFGRSLYTEDSLIPVPKFKTFQVALICPTFYAAKYNSGNFNVTTGGVENHLLILGNMVAGLFQDASIGEIKVTYVVTEIKIILPTNYEFMRNSSKSFKLKKLVGKVGAWKAAKNVTYDGFSYISNAVTDGAVANFNSVCRSTPGTVNRDIGLQTAFHIAHETGHNFGLEHDDGACAAQTHIMYAVLLSGQYVSKWSECSRDVFQRFLKNSARSACLDDAPSGDHLTLPARFHDKLPGTYIDGNMQCEMLFGYGWRRHYTTNCAELLCSKGYTVLSKGVVVLDGTNCGLTKWCISGRCEHRGVLPIDGGWSEWSSYTNCSRECGGGLQYMQRKCDNPKPAYGGASCKGEAKELNKQLCNTQECPSGQKDYRQTVCDEKMPGSRTYYHAPQICRVFCRSGSTIGRAGIVPDGYRCRANKKDYSVCISGQCRRVGCDHVLDSETLEDRCGECNGNGDSCSRVRLTYTDSPDQNGPDHAVLITELPVGTTGAFFLVAKDTYNYLGVQDAKGSYIVGGHLGNSQVKPAAGTIIHYSHKKKKAFKDTITINEPTQEVLRVVYVKKNENSGDNPGVNYHFVVLGQPPNSSAYKWVTGDWSTCSRTCAVGLRSRNVRCVRVDDETPASDSACSGEMPKVEECNTQPCTAKWVYSKWSHCSKTCGHGKQERSIRCLEEVAPNDFRETNSCSAPKPQEPTSQLCSRYPCPASWFTGNWSACSTQCSIGTKRRQVLCSRINELGIFSVVDTEFCRYLDKAPPTELPCNEDSPCGVRLPICPDDHLCSNGGKCVPDPAGYKCVCDRGFTGVECEIKLDPCEKNPCLNGGTCSLGVIHHYSHTCQCPSSFTGANCDTKITACMSYPCLNGGTCTDDGAFDKYTCTCPGEFVGEQCQVSKFYHIGCFNHDSNAIPVLQEQRKRELDINEVSAAVIKCAELAQGNDYKYFAVGYKGVCYSGPQANETYFQKGPAQTKKKCTSAGDGKQRTSVVYTFEPVPSYQPLGCFRGAKRRNKALRTKYMSFGNQGNKIKQTTIDQCARIALAKGYVYFAVQNTAECWSDQDAQNRYKMLGASTKCIDGVGLKGTNMVYRFNE